jgi:hypothetical protein
LPCTAGIHVRLNLRHWHQIIVAVDFSGVSESAIKDENWIQIKEARARQRETLVIAEQLGSPGPEEETAAESAVRFEPAGDESLPAQGAV